MNWTTACPDWERRIVNRESLIPIDPLFPDEAAASLAVFKELKVVDIPGKPTMGEVCAQWVFDFVAAIFGAYDCESGRRLINEFLLIIAKKNSKSTIAAGIMLTALIRNWRPYSEAYILAPTIEIAKNSFYPARGMVREDEELSDLFLVQDHYKKITHRGNDSFLQVVAADSDTVGGKKGSFILIDETWLFGKKQHAENMFTEACGGLASRTEGFVINLSTMSDEAPAGVFEQKLRYGRGVRDGKIDDNQFLPVIYEFPKKMLKNNEHKDPKNFYVTNPNLGLSVDIPYIERKFKQAQIDGDASMAGFLAKHLNVELKTVLKASPWSGAPHWDKQGCELSLDDVLSRSEVLVIGIDGGGLDDLLGISVLGREIDTKKWLLWNRAWVCLEGVHIRKVNESVYRDFERDGDLFIVPVGEHIQAVGDIVVKCDETGLLDRVGVDPSGISSIYREIVDNRELDEERVVGISQGWRLTSSIKETGLSLAGNTLLHGGTRLMAWCVSNAREEPKGNAVLVTKQASGKGKIDPLMATFNAVALMAMNPEARNTKSVYETRGVLSI